MTRTTSSTARLLVAAGQRVRLDRLRSGAPVAAGCYRRLAWEALRCGPLPALWRAAASCEGSR